MLAAIVSAWSFGWKIGTFYSNDNREFSVGVAYDRQNCQEPRFRRYCKRVLFRGGELCGERCAGHDRVATLTKVKHKRELLFASLPTLFAVHQFIEGFAWLGLDGVLSPAVTHKMGAAFVLYAQGLLPFVIPLSVLLLNRL
jgi:hypothetical protein